MKEITLVLLVAAGLMAHADDFTEDVTGGVSLTAQEGILLDARGTGPLSFSTLSASQPDDIDMFSSGNVVIDSGAGYQVYVAGESLQAVTDHGVQLSQMSAKAACDETRRGTVYYTAGGAGATDAFEFCMKDSSDQYAWKQVSP